MWSLTWGCASEGVRWNRTLSDPVVVRFGGQRRPVAWRSWRSAHLASVGASRVRRARLHSLGKGHVSRCPANAFPVPPSTIGAAAALLMAVHRLRGLKLL